MNLIQSFKVDDTPHEVGILWKENKPLYRASDIAKILDIHNIETVLQHISQDEKMNTNEGEQNVVYLREKAVYIIALRANQPINIVDHFIRCFLSVTDAIREKEEKRRRDNESRRFYVECSKIKHDSLVSAFRKKTPVVYFGRINTDDPDTSLIKIGHTDDVYSRTYNLVAEYGSFHYVDIFECQANKNMANFLHTHNDIRCHCVTNKRTNKLYKFTEDQMNTAIEIVRKNLHKFQMNEEDMITKELKKEIEHLKKIVKEHIIEKEESKCNTDQNDDKISAFDTKNESQTNQNTHEKKSEKEQNTESSYIINNSNYKMCRGNKVQRYSPDGATLLHTYNGFLEAERDTELDSPVSSVIRLAAKNKTIYKGFRWAELDRSLDDTTYQDIGETVGASTQRKGFVAMLHIDGSHIVRVFSDQKEAAKDRNFKGCAPVCMAIQKGSVSGGHRFRMWYDCSDELKKKFLESGGQLPAPTVRSHALQVEQLHAITGEVLRTFSSAAHVIKEYPMSRASLMQAIEGNLIKRGYKWRLLKKDDNEDQN